MKYDYQWWLKENYKNISFAWQDLFVDEECDAIIDLGLNNVTPMKLSIPPGVTDNAISRKSKVTFLPILDDSQWIFEKIVRAVTYQNKKWWKYDLDYIEALQFTEYDSSYNGYFKRHIDSFYVNRFTRKLSFHIQLSDPNSYEGSDVLIYRSENPDILEKNRGRMNIFPSYHLNEVTRITKGTRYSLEGWIVGPSFK